MWRRHHCRKFVTHQAKCHKYCYLIFNDTKLQRARKRQQERECMTETLMMVLLYKIKFVYIQQQLLEKNNCIIYTKYDGNLHEFRTFDADNNMRRMAIDLMKLNELNKVNVGT